MTMTMLLCAFVLLIITVNAQWVIEDDGCRTPNRGVGKCIAIADCKPMNDFLDKAPQPLSPEAIKILRSYQCGFDRHNPKVCCSDTPISLPSTDTRNPLTTTPQPPDVSNHRNLRLIPENCGHVDTGDRIINGNKTGIFEFPWMAILSYRTTRGPEFKCGGTIINERYILTAAHCITNLKFPLLGVRVGDHNINTQKDCETQADGDTICAPPYKDLAIEATIPHPRYNTSVFANDIGLLRVTRMNLGQENIRPVCLPLGKTRMYNFTNKNVVVTGWGATETGRNSPDLLKVEMPVIPLETCQKTYAKSAPIGYQQLCAGGRNQHDSCAGDSGGPLHVVGQLNDDTRYIQQGVVSFGPKFCGLENNPGVYTRVAYFMDWLLDTIKN